MEKMTAVEWLVEKILDEHSKEECEILIKKAKEMEKEQNEIWWAKGWNDGHLSTLQENIEKFETK